MKATLHHRGPVSGGGPARVLNLVDPLTQVRHDPKDWPPQRPRVRVADAYWFKGLYSRLEELNSDGQVIAAIYVRN